MALFGALSWSGANSALRILLSFFSAKVSAIYLGPSGMALVGVMNNFIQVSNGAIANGAQTAVVNLTADRREDHERLQRLWGTAVWSVLVLGGLLALIVLPFASQLSTWLLFDAKYWPVIVAGAFVVMFAVVDTVLIGALNGLKQIKLIASASIVSTIVEFMLFAGLTYKFGIWGALFAIAAIYGSKLLVSSSIAFRSGLVSPRALISTFDRQTLKEIWRFYPMLLAHSLAIPLAQILVRNGTVRTLGLEQGGYLQATWRLSDMYVGVLTTALGFFFMAHFSSLETEPERGQMLRRTTLQLSAIATCCALTIYLLRDVIIGLVLTASFAPMRALLPFQLLGDVLKVVHYPLQMAVASQRRAGAFIALTLGGSALYVTLSEVWRPFLAVQAAPAAYAASYLLVVVTLLWLLRGTLAAKAAPRTPLQAIETA
jgi:Membrane protein involved in the export of O-antigen and teichoic acid